MSISISERHMAENEAVFRRYNESVKKSMDRLKKIAVEDNQEEFLDDDNDAPLYFYCECSDENCKMRILINPSEYTKIHKRRDRFVVLRGHEVKSIERIIVKKDNFSIVEKDITPSEDPDTLHTTPVSNI